MLCWSASQSAAATAASSWPTAPSAWPARPVLLEFGTSVLGAAVERAVGVLDVEQPGNGFVQRGLHVRVGCLRLERRAPRARWRPGRAGCSSGEPVSQVWPASVLSGLKFRRKKPCGALLREQEVGRVGRLVGPSRGQPLCGVRLADDVGVTEAVVLVLDPACDRRCLRSPPLQQSHQVLAAEVGRIRPRGLGEDERLRQGSGVRRGDASERRGVPLALGPRLDGVGDVVRGGVLADGTQTERDVGREAEVVEVELVVVDDARRSAGP